MFFAAPVIATNLLVPVVMLLGGLAILVAGLVLLTSRRPRGEESGPVLVGDGMTAPPCDWSAVLESSSGERIALRTAKGRECCGYVFRLLEAAHVGDEQPAADERLFYSGSATQIGRDAAVTALLRETISRTVSSTPTEIDGVLALERSRGPAIGSPGWEQLPEREGELGRSFDTRAKQAWETHLDQLRAHGAQLAVGNVSDPAVLAHREQLDLHLAVTRGCDAEPPMIELSGECRVTWEMQGASEPLHHVEAQLAAWVLADDLDVVASHPSSPPTGIEAWQPIESHPDHGVALVCDPGADAAAGEWTGHGDVEVTKPEATITVGSGILLEAVAAHIPESSATLRARAECVLQVRIHPRPLASEPSGSAGEEAQPVEQCACAGATLELTLGTPWRGSELGPRVDSTMAGQMRLDDRAIRLGRGARAAWRVAEADPQPTGQDVQELEGSR